jgi:hypothetical protein
MRKALIAEFLILIAHVVLLAIAPFEAFVSLVLLLLVVLNLRAITRADDE